MIINRLINYQDVIKMDKWYNKPIKIFSMKRDIDYIMCIDENGSSSNLTYVLKQISKEKTYLKMINFLLLQVVYLQKKNI